MTGDDEQQRATSSTGSSTDGLANRLDRIVEQLHGIHVVLENLRVSLTGLSQVSDDHEVRLRRLEAWTHRLSPWLTLVSFLAGGAVSTMVDRWM